MFHGHLYSQEHLAMTFFICSWGRFAQPVQTGVKILVGLKMGTGKVFLTAVELEAKRYRALSIFPPLVRRWPCRY